MSMLLGSVDGPSRNKSPDVFSVNPYSFLYRRNHMESTRRLEVEMPQPDSGCEHLGRHPSIDMAFITNLSGHEPLCQISVRIFSRM
jgi:hypothetical protein